MEEINKGIEPPFGEVYLGYHTRFINKFVSNNLVRSKRQISFHYDLGNEFYSKWLDETMTYSSAIFNDSEDLTYAQNNKYKQIVKTANNVQIIIKLPIEL